MTKIAFVQEETLTRFGVMFLSAVLKKAGHSTDVFIADKTTRLVEEVAEFDPDLIAFSTMTPGEDFALDTARELKKVLDRPIIMGGPHPTFYTEVLKEDCLDILCIGEGEDAIVELAERMETGRDIADIANLHVKVDGRIFENEMRQVVDPDSLPFPDRDIYFDKYADLRYARTKPIWVVRGCPFDCTYCFNHKLKKMMVGKGKYLRYGSIERVIEEIKFIKEKYDMKWANLMGDTVNADKRWFLAFLEKYKVEVGLPFLVNIRVENLDEETVRKMKDAGCDRVVFAVESGDQKLRNIIKRPMTDETITNAGKWFNKFGIRMHTANIIGLPYETLDTALKTVRINQIMGPEIARAFILQPFENTEIREFSVEHGLLDPDWDGKTGATTYSRNVSKYDFQLPLKMENKKRIINMFYFFSLMVSYPKLEKFFMLLTHFPPNRLYRFMYMIPVVLLDIKYSDTTRQKLSIAYTLVKTLGFMPKIRQRA